MSSSAAPTTHPEADAQLATGAAHCLNCHHRLAGPYCHHCGQAASTPRRITLHYLLHDIPHSIWHVDHGVVYTLREMLLRPGRTIQRYLGGERAPFFRPLSLLLLVAGITSFLFLALHIVPYYVDPRIPPELRTLQTRFSDALMKYQSWFYILFLPINAGLAHLILRRRLPYSYAEQLVANALLTGTVTTILLAFIPAMWYWSGQPPTMRVAFAMLGVQCLFKGWGFAQLQAANGTGRPLGRWVRGLAIPVLEYVCTVFLMIALMVVILLLRH